MKVGYVSLQVNEKYLGSRGAQNGVRGANKQLGMKTTQRTVQQILIDVLVFTNNDVD